MSAPRPLRQLPIPRCRRAGTRLLKGEHFFDRGSLLNGTPVDLLAALRTTPQGQAVTGDVGWVPQWANTVHDAAAVPALVRAGAGAGRLQVSPN